MKGLTPEPLHRARLMPGRCLPWDRAFALAQGDAAFDPENPAWVKKTHFMCLARNAKVAGLTSRFDEATGILAITTPEGQRLNANPLTPTGQDALTSFLTDYLGAEARYGAEGKAPRFHHFPNHSFCDHKTQVISLIGLGSLAALEAAAEAPRDKRRFRANIYIEDIEPWAEFAWMGRRLRVGETVLEVQEHDRPLRRHHGEPRHGRARRQPGQGAATAFWPYRARRVRRGGSGRRDQARG